MCCELNWVCELHDLKETKWLNIKFLYLMASFDAMCSSEEAAASPKSKILNNYYIPNYILVSGSEVQRSSLIPSCPVLVFINSKSGGQLGGKLLLTYRSLLNENQVIP